MQAKIDLLPMRLLFLLALLMAACRPATNGPVGVVTDRPIRVVATTSLVADLVRQIGGDRVEVEALMGPGVDPHLYQASEGDVSRMSDADLVVYNGLHLEGRMGDLFEGMAQTGRRTLAVADVLPADSLIHSAQFASSHDPHIWNSPPLWQMAAAAVADGLREIDPAHAADYDARLANYAAELDSLDGWVRAELAHIPPATRVLVTAHDAFGYFGRAFGVEVEGLQGLSTAAEAGTADVQRLAELIATRRIPAIFVESSVSPRSIEAVQAAVRDRGFDVQIGGSLYSDALGGPGSGAETYTGMMRANVRTIIDALVP